MYYTDHLQSPRLITRFVTQDDVPVWLDYCRDSVATRFTAMPGKTPEEFAQFFIDRALARYEAGEYGLQALISKDTGEFIGQCGLIKQHVNGIDEVEVGYHLLPRHWGKGYATEAARLFRDYGFEHNVADSIISIIDPQNFPSKKVALRNGMTLVATDMPFRDAEYNIFRITRSEWETLRQAGVPAANK